jgi:hypothetical protein
MNSRTDAVQLSGRSWYQALALTLSGTRPKMTVVEAAARTKAVEYFHIEPALQFRVVATKLEKVKERA